MVKLIAKVTIISSKGRIVAGSKFEAEDVEAEVLIASGYAEEDTSKPEQPPTDKPSGKK